MSRKKVLEEIASLPRFESSLLAAISLDHSRDEDLRNNNEGKKMSEKSAVSALIAADVSVKLDKEDIVALVIDQHESELEAEKTNLKYECELAEQELKTLVEQWRAETLKQFEAHYKKLISALTDTISGSSPITVQLDRAYSGNQEEILELRGKRAVDVQPLSVTGLIITVHHQNLRLPGVTMNKARRDIANEFVEVSVSRDALSERLAEVETDLENVDRSSRRARSKLARNILGTTEAGRTLLAQLTGTLPAKKLLK